MANPWLLVSAIAMTLLYVEGILQYDWNNILVNILLYSFYVMRMIYVNTGRSFKRIEALSKFKKNSNNNEPKATTSILNRFIFCSFQAVVRSSHMSMHLFKDCPLCVLLTQLNFWKWNSTNSKIWTHRVGIYSLVHRVGLHFGWTSCAFCSSPSSHTVS